MTTEITIRLNVFERRFLLMLAERGGSADMSHSNMSRDVINALDELKKKAAISISLPIVGIGYRYALTSVGVNLVDVIKREVV